MGMYTMSQSSLRNNYFWYICTLSGLVAERLGNGLQNRVQRFESARDLNQKARCDALGFLFYCQHQGLEQDQNPGTTH